MNSPSRRDLIPGFPLIPHWLRLRLGCKGAVEKTKGWEKNWQVCRFFFANDYGWRWVEKDRVFREVRGEHDVEVFFICKLQDDTLLSFWMRMDKRQQLPAWWFPSFQSDLLEAGYFCGLEKQIADRVWIRPKIHRFPMRFKTVSQVASLSSWTYNLSSWTKGTLMKMRKFSESVLFCGIKELGDFFPKKTQHGWSVTSATWEFPRRLGGQHSS